MKTAAGIALLMMMLLSLGAGSALAQFSSGIEGTAHDQSGAVIPGAKVTLTDTRLGVVKSATSNQDGYFRIDSIAASTYTIQVQMAGFKTWSQPNLTLQVGEVRTISPALEIGAVSSDVSVSAADSAALNTVSATTGAIIGQETVQETPLPGQNVYGLTALTPGMTGSAVTSGDNYTNEYAININAAGLRQEQNGFEIDGAYTNTPSRGGGTLHLAQPGDRAVHRRADQRLRRAEGKKRRSDGQRVYQFRHEQLPRNARLLTLRTTPDRKDAL